MIMKPYGRHKPSNICQCVMCGPDKKSKGRKKAERSRAKKEIRDEVSKVDKRRDMQSRDS